MTMTALLATLPPPLKSFVWSVRREIWEHRIVLTTPPGVAALVLLGYLGGMPFGIHAGLADPLRQLGTIVMAYNVGCFLCMVGGLAAALFYCLEALHGERRDRSILFWKSLPVSDCQTVLAKLAVPVVVLPAIVFVAVAVLWLAILVATTAILGVTGLAVAPLWSAGAFAVQLSWLAYALGVTALWYLPVYCALLLVSVWAKHAPFLWASLPLALIAAVDALVFRSGQVKVFYLYRLFGWYDEALRLNAAHLPVGRDPAKLFASPGLWLGLAVAAVLLAAAVRLRRRSGPI
jgi:ABC-2 type transport system permease protein